MPDAAGVSLDGPRPGLFGIPDCPGAPEGLLTGATLHVLDAGVDSDIDGLCHYEVPSPTDGRDTLKPLL